MRSKEIERSLKNWINVPAILIPYIIYSFIGYIPETNAQNINKNLYGFLGGEVQFNCNYTDSDDSIISIDWFFSRDTASIGVPILTVNPHESVQINSQWNDRIAFHDPTTNTSFTLKNLKEGDQGIYRCTVIGDNTITHDQYLEVYDPPDEQEGLKVIEDFKPLAVGETMIYTCQSSNSKPATKLTWMINDVPVDNDMVKLNLTLTDPGSGASTSVLKILMVGSNELNGAKLTCKATLPNQSVKEWTKMIQITPIDYKNALDRQTRRNIWGTFVRYYQSQGSPIVTQSHFTSTSAVVSGVTNATRTPKSTNLSIFVTPYPATMSRGRGGIPFWGKRPPVPPISYHNNIYVNNHYYPPQPMTPKKYETVSEREWLYQNTNTSPNTMLSVTMSPILTNGSYKFNPFKYSAFPLPILTNVVPKGPPLQMPPTTDRVPLVLTMSHQVIDGVNMDSNLAMNTPAVPQAEGPITATQMGVGIGIETYSTTPTAQPGSVLTNIPLAEHTNLVVGGGMGDLGVTTDAIQGADSSWSDVSLSTVVPVMGIVTNENMHSEQDLNVTPLTTILTSDSEFAMRNKSFSDLNMMIAAGGPRDVSVTAPMRSDMAGDTTKKPSSGTSLILGHNFNHVYWLTILMIAIARILV